MKKEEVKISVIIPIYNVEKFVGKCIESVLNQTLDEIEIFAVDDGSPDNSGKICDDYAKKDKRLIVIHKKMVVHQKQEMWQLKKQKVNIYILLIQMTGLKRIILKKCTI